MKTKGMKQQLEALKRMAGAEAFGLFMEQGTGKTWTLLADAERLYASGMIDGLFVVAPKGVHTNWVNREIPTHMEVPVLARAWRSGAGKRAMKHIEELFKPRERGEPPPLRVLSMNIDALMTKDGLIFAKRFLLATKALFVIDESSRIKNPSAGRTKEIMLLKPLSKYRRILTGTPITNAPMDVFAQMEFLDEGLLGTTSYRSFVAEYAELLNINHPLMQNLIKANPRSANAQVVAKNPDGSPRWRNLDKLQKLLQPHTYRVLKSECLDLPAKIYQTHPFELTPAQRKAYDLMHEEHRIEIVDGEELPVDALAALMKLQQITSGFVVPPGGDPERPIYVDVKNPRLEAIAELMQDIHGKVIIWARFREELRAIGEMLRKAGYKVVEYHGGVKDKDREIAVDSFQNGDADIFLGQAQSGGIGLTLTAAETVIYASNDFNRETRAQSEDRCHRIGTTKHVVYWDIIGEDTIDEAIARSLQRKAAVAAVILGDYAAHQQAELRATNGAGPHKGTAPKVKVVPAPIQGDPCPPDAADQYAALLTGASGKSKR